VKLNWVYRDIQVCNPLHVVAIEQCFEGKNSQPTDGLETYVTMTHVFLDGSESVDFGNVRWHKKNGESIWRSWPVQFFAPIWFESR
jgi:hypothetical protein